ncbi:MAG: T9SS type A sorting domain-containing protein [Ignavibacteria bacterium]
MRSYTQSFARAGLKFSLLSFLFVLMLVSLSNAQTAHHIINGTTTIWSSDQSFTSSVIVDSGAVLRINAGVNVKFYYADNNGDNIGDYGIQVASGGRLAIYGTPASPVIFGPAEATPQAVNWQGIVLDANSSTSAIQDTLKFFTVSYAKAGLTINRPVQLHAPTISNAAAGMVVNAFTSAARLILPVATFTNVAGSAMVINQPNTDILYPTITTVTAGNGIEVNAGNVTINWAAISSVSGTGILVSASGLNLSVNHTSVRNSGKSGLFNVDGSVTIDSSTFNSNTFNGVVNSSGVLSISNSKVDSNAVDGIVAAGLSTTTAQKVDLSSNTKYGLNISDLKILTDVAVIAGSAEVAPTVSVTYSNIYNNNSTLPDVNNGSASTIASLVNNYWLVIANIASQISGTANSVNFTSWVISGSPYTVIGADFAAALSITVDNKVLTGGLNYIETVSGSETTTAPFTLTWTTKGNFPLVKIVKKEYVEDPSALTPLTTPTNTVTDYFANTGSYTVTPTKTTPLSFTLVVSRSALDGNSAAPVAPIDTVIKQTGLTLIFPSPTHGKDADSVAIALAGGQDTVITWIAPASIANVKLAYKITDVATTWTTIVSSTPNTGSYTWRVPNFDVKGLAATGCKLMITEVGGTAFDSTDNLRGFAIYPTPDATWNFTNTGHSEIVNFTAIAEDTTGTVAAELQSRIFFKLSELIYVGAFYTDGATVKCAGYVKSLIGDNVPGSANQYTLAKPLTIYGDDPTTLAKEGFTAGEAITFRVWRTAHPDSAGTPWGSDDNSSPLNYRKVTVNVATFYGTGNMIAEDTLHYTVATTDTGGQRITLSAGWQLISSYIIPTVDSLVWGPATDNNSINNHILGTLTTGELQGFTVNADSALFKMLKDADGKVYWADTSTSGTPLVTDFYTWDPNKGYLLNMSGTPTGVLRLDGKAVVPETNTISLVAGWNIIPYHRYSNMAPEIALNTIKAGLTVVKDLSGNVYWPAYGINTLGNLTPGKAYQVKVSSAQTLVYPANTVTIPGVAKSAEAPQASSNSHFKMEFNSDNSSVVAFTENSLKGKAVQGDEIGVFNSEGKLCGSTVYNGGNVAVVIFGLESGKQEGKGMKASESYSFRVWNKNAGAESILNGVDYSEGAGSYSVNGVSVVGSVTKAESSVPQEFSLSQNYPNPFNPTTTISFGIPQDSKVKIVVYNMLGQAVKELANEFFSAGYHNVKLDASKLASGVYIYKINADKFSASRKMNLLK